MLSTIFYIVTIILLLIVFLLINKSKNKQNILLWIFISQIFIFCYNAVIVYLLSIFNIKSTLITLSLINFVITLILYIFIIRNNSIQKYYIKKIDILTVLIISMIVIIIGYLRFGFPFKIVYETVDPGTHFWTSMDFFRESILLNKAETAVDFSSRVFGSYVNMGIVFKVFYNFVGYINLYCIYIIYDLYMLFLSGTIFYFVIRYLCENKKFLLSLISSIIYLFGYPLNNMLFGFFYSGHVVILFCVLILIFKFIDNHELKEKTNLFLITLLNLGICFTYYLYAPIIAISEILYFIYRYKVNKDYNIKQIIKRIIFIILIPLVLTILYFVIPYISVKQYNVFNQLKIDGYCYNSYLSNFIIFIPLIIYYIGKMSKQKKFNFEIFLFFANILLVFIITFLSIFSLALQYYASKFYYVLWLLCFILSFNMLNQKEVNQTFCSIYFSTFIIIVLFSVFSIEEHLYDKNDGFGNRLESTNLLNIYSWNIDKIKYTNITFTVEEIEIIKKLYEIDAKNVINNFNLSFNGQRLWLNAFFWTNKLNYPENEIYGYMVKDVFYDPIEYNCYCNMDSNYKYFVIFYRDFASDKWNKYRDILPYEVQRRWDDDFRKDYTINKKNNYDIINRETCENCQFIDFEDGLIIIK